MANQMFGVIMISPLQALSNPDRVIQEKEARDVCMFDAPSHAFQYLIQKANTYSTPGHTTPIGHALNRYYEIPSIGIMYRLNPPEEMTIEPKRATDPEDVYMGIKYRGAITPFDVIEQKAILLSDVFHKQQVEPIEMDVLKEKLSERLRCYDALQATLESTPKIQRKEFSPEMTPEESLRMALGPDSPMHNEWVSPYPQDQKFWDIQKELHDANAGFTYTVEPVQFLYNRYRDVYARNIVGGDTMETASNKAAIVVLDRLSKLAVEKDDPRVEQVLQDIGEKVALDILGREDTERD